MWSDPHTCSLLCVGEAGEGYDYTHDGTGNTAGLRKITTTTLCLSARWQSRHHEKEEGRGEMYDGADTKLPRTRSVASV